MVVFGNLLRRHRVYILFVSCRKNWTDQGVLKLHFIRWSYLAACSDDKVSISSSLVSTYGHFEGARKLRFLWWSFFVSVSCQHIWSGWVLKGKQNSLMRRSRLWLLLDLNFHRRGLPVRTHSSLLRRNILRNSGRDRVKLWAMAKVQINTFLRSKLNYIHYRQCIQLYKRT